MFMNNLGRAMYAATHRRFFMTEKQRLWGGVYRCAYLRWRDSDYQSKGDYETMVTALGLGDQFWE